MHGVEPVLTGPMVNSCYILGATKLSPISDKISYFVVVIDTNAAVVVPVVVVAAAVVVENKIKVPDSKIYFHFLFEIYPFICTIKFPVPNRKFPPRPYGFSESK